MVDLPVEPDLALHLLGGHVGREELHGDRPPRDPVHGAVDAGGATPDRLGLELEPPPDQALGDARPLDADEGP